jgi:release factor glutamine methyltransferase
MPVLEQKVAAAAAVERIADAVRRVTRALGEAGIEAPGGDARRLIAAATGLSAAQLLAAPEAHVDPAAARTLAEMVRRRCAREPVSRILGTRDFYGRTFKVTPATLDPRPDSETLIEAALAIAGKEGWRDLPIRILDIGTGSGCLLVTLLAELPQASGVGGDISEEALAVASENALGHGVLSRLQVALHDGLEGLDGPFDLVVCNPPYIASGEISGLSPEVRDYDPRAALDGGPDGLDVYRALMPSLTRVISKGWVLFEVGAGQVDAVAQLLYETIPADRRGALRIWRDLGGHERCVAMEIQLLRCRKESG